MRVFIHVQALSGVGHFVRAFEIARALAERHQVFLLDGSRPIPRRPAPVTPVSVPRLERVEGRLHPMAGNGALPDVLRGRIAEIERVIRAVRPDVLLIEHFPFSKWDLEGEYRAVIAAARSVRPGVKVVCSVRDIVRKTRFDDGPGWEARPYRHRVRDALALFDLVLVHTDPRFTRVEEHVPWIHETPSALQYTGFVSQKLPEADLLSERVRGWLEGRGLVVAAAGSGTSGDRLLAGLIEAWRDLAGEPPIDGHALVVFRSLRSSAREDEHLARLADGMAVRIERFDPAFLEWVSLAECCVSRAGYNTCTNLLETRCRGLLVPDQSMSDQPARAQRLRELGLADVLADPGPDTWPDALRRALQGPRPVHDLALDGAARTREFLETL